jgi:hypothetical protein
VVAWDELSDRDVLECPCGWEGPLSRLVPEDFQEVIDLSCPQCDRTLVLRSRPAAAPTDGA